MGLDHWSTQKTSSICYCFFTLFTSYLYYRHGILTRNPLIGNVNVGKIIGPSFCDDVRIQRNLNIGFLACDPSFPYRNYAASIFDESQIKEDGALWVYDLNKVRLALFYYSEQGVKGCSHELKTVKKATVKGPSD
jgi:hypothetical protein